MKSNFLPGLYKSINIYFKILRNSNEKEKAFRKTITGNSITLFPHIFENDATKLLTNVSIYIYYITQIQ